MRLYYSLFLIVISGLLISLFLTGWASDEAGRPVTTSSLTQEIEKLIEELGHNDWSIREAATEKLSRMGQPAVPFLKKALTHSDAEIVMRARLLLRLLKWNIPLELKTQIGPLMAGYDESAPAERRQIIMQLFSHQKSALPVLFKIMEFEQDDQVSSQAYEFITRFLNDDEAAGSALTLLKDVEMFWPQRLTGQIYEMRGKYFEAIRHYEKAFQLNQSFTELVSTLQNLYQQTQNWAQAIKFFQALIAAKPEVVEYRINLGLMHEYNGEKETAQIIWQKILELNSLNENQYDLLATIYLERTQNDQAVQTYQTAANRLPGNNNLKIKLARTHRKIGQFNEASGILEPLLKTNQPKEIIMAILEELGRCYFLNNEPDLARKTWWKLVDQSALGGQAVIPDDYIFLGRIFEEYEIFDEQLKLYENAYRQRPDYPIIANSLARANIRMGNFKNALKILLDIYSRTDRFERDGISPLPGDIDPDSNAHFFIMTCLADRSLPSWAAGLIQEKLAGLPDPAKPAKESDILSHYKLLTLLCQTYAIASDDKQIAQVLEEAFQNKEPGAFAFRFFPYLYELASLACSAKKYT
ncbi:MAG: tetratricopeptide repeat protein, partial [Planctomycetota bacterium]